MKNILFKGLQTNLSKNPGQWLIGLMGLIAFFFILFWLLKGLYSILTLAAPVLLILTAIINYRVLTGYISMLWSVFQKNWIVGILGTILTVIGLPFVSGFLFVKALLLRKVSGIQTAMENKRMGEFVDFEDVSEEPSDILILKEPEIKGRNKYDDTY